MLEKIKMEIRAKIINKSFKLFEHYYIVLGNNEMEYHINKFGPPLIKKPDKTKNNYRVVENFLICPDCEYKLIAYYKQNHHLIMQSFYPLINCETLVCGISIQTYLLFFISPILISLCVHKKYLLFLIGLIITLIILYLIRFIRFEKNMFSKNICPH